MEDNFSCRRGYGFVEHEIKHIGEVGVSIRTYIRKHIYKYIYEGCVVSREIDRWMDGRREIPPVGSSKEYN